MDNYEVGDEVIYQPFSGPVRRVTVDTKEADIKNGRAGFAGQDTDGFGCWGYDCQIIAVVSNRPRVLR
jgi:hypothetical protein